MLAAVAAASLAAAAAMAIRVGGPATVEAASAAEAPAGVKVAPLSRQSAPIMVAATDNEGEDNAPTTISAEPAARPRRGERSTARPPPFQPSRSRPREVAVKASLPLSTADPYYAVATHADPAEPSPRAVDSSPYEPRPGHEACDGGEHVGARPVRPRGHLSALPCMCPVCRRRFVVVSAVAREANDASTRGARCVCGRELVAVELHEGVYEVRRSRRATRRKPTRDATRPPAHAHGPMPVEPDQGYGESHGYGPAHGGPTGPADAPAPETTSSDDPA